MKKKMIGMTMLALALFSNFEMTTFAKDSMDKKHEIESLKESETFCDDNTIDEESKQILLNELNLSEFKLSREDEIALFSSGTVWNQTYGNTTYSIRKNLAMTASLTSTNTNKPYTKITVTNKGKNSLTVIAYKGAVAGSSSIASMTVGAGATKTLTITRNHVIKYGTINTQGTNAALAYVVSIYNSSGKAIPCSVKAIKYS